ncbi:MAG: hypothetical protein H6581_24130 [Bacteroidia bacterium]|nr:hypothetical protein [Bacteroidia bacterium]
MKIIFQYKTTDVAEIITRNLTPEQYFDPDILEPGEGFSWDSVPLNLFPHQYLGLSQDKIAFTKVEIEDEVAGVNYVRSERFFNEGKCVIGITKMTGAREKFDLHMTVQGVGELPDLIQNFSIGIKDDIPSLWDYILFSTEPEVRDLFRESSPPGKFDH